MLYPGQILFSPWSTWILATQLSPIQVQAVSDVHGFRVVELDMVQNAITGFDKILSCYIAQAKKFDLVKRAFETATRQEDAIVLNLIHTAVSMAIIGGSTLWNIHRCLDVCKTTIQYTGLRRRGELRAQIAATADVTCAVLKSVIVEQVDKSHAIAKSSALLELFEATKKSKRPQIRGFDPKAV